MPAMSDNPADTLRKMLVDAGHTISPEGEKHLQFWHDYLSQPPPVDAPGFKIGNRVEYRPCLSCRVRYGLIKDDDGEGRFWVQFDHDPGNLRWIAAEELRREIV
jgi:hypothetical protein